MKIAILTLTTLALLSTTAFAETKVNVPAKEASQIFKAASFAKTKHGWEGNCDTGEITTYKDLNGDGLKDAVISVHALTRSATLRSNSPAVLTCYFNPRTHEECDIASFILPLHFFDFNPRTHEECD